VKSRYVDTCINCKSKLPEKPFVFQGVVICENCFKVVSHCVQKTKKELNMLFLVYTDMLRAALVKGELHFPPAVPEGQEMPVAEFSRAFTRLVEKIGGRNAQTEKGPNGKGQVPELRVDDRDADGQVPHR